MEKFKRVILYARAHRVNYGVTESLEKIKAYFSDKKVQLFADEDTANFFPDIGVPVLARKDMGEPQDLVLVVGGDGTMLSAARMAIQVNVPVIGINRGRLGFLTDICPDEIETEFDEVLKGNYFEETRFLLRTEIRDDENVFYQGDSLNDVVLMPGDEPHLVQFQLYVNKEFVCNHNADGLIIATPTGSTAYSLSAGGPIVYPSLKVISIMPMFSHSLNSRPIVIDCNAEIQIRISQHNEHSPRISCDGHERQLIKPGQSAVIRKNTQQLRLLHPSSHDYYHTLRSKLGWESKVNYNAPYSR